MGVGSRFIYICLRIADYVLNMNTTLLGAIQRFHKDSYKLYNNKRGDGFISEMTLILCSFNVLKLAIKNLLWKLSNRGFLNALMDQWLVVCFS